MPTDCLTASPAEGVSYIRLRATADWTAEALIMDPGVHKASSLVRLEIEFSLCYTVVCKRVFYIKASALGFVGIKNIGVLKNKRFARVSVFVFGVD